jgi:ribosomal protein S18 acetylase RimI-like enzyme
MPMSVDPLAPAVSSLLCWSEGRLESASFREQGEPKLPEVTLRAGGPGDYEAALAVFRAAEAARSAGRGGRPGSGERVRAHLEDATSFLTVAEVESAVVGMAMGMQGLSEDGAGPPVAGLCHVAAVFVSPRHWGAGVGGRLVDRVLEEARARGYDRAQLWTHADNVRARRLYERRGFEHTGRSKEVERGEIIVHYARQLASA